MNPRGRVTGVVKPIVDELRALERFTAVTEITPTQWGALRTDLRNREPEVELRLAVLAQDTHDIRVRVCRAGLEHVGARRQREASPDPTAAIREYAGIT